MRDIGNYEIWEGIRYFQARPLPPAQPSLQWEGLLHRYGEASAAWGMLQGGLLHHPHRAAIQSMFLLRESMAACAIDGMHTDMSEIFLSTVRSSANQAVGDYKKFLEWKGTTSLPLSDWLTSPILAQAVAMVLGEKQHVRVTGNTIASKKDQSLFSAIAALEHYVCTDHTIPDLVKLGLVYAQWDLIRPCTEGHGRVGRALLSGMLRALSSPLGVVVPISEYFYAHCFEYQQCLEHVRTRGDFESWIAYYLTALTESSRAATQSAHRILAMDSALRLKIMEDPQFYKMRDTALCVLEALFQHPITTVSTIGAWIDKSYNTTHAMLKQFIACGVVTEVSSHVRNKYYHFTAYLQCFHPPC